LISKNDKRVCVIGGCLSEYELEHLCQLVSKGREIADVKNSTVECIGYGINFEEKISLIFKSGAHKVTYFRQDKYYDEEIFRDEIVNYIKRNNPYLVIMKSSIFDKALASAVATILNIGLVADCAKISFNVNETDIIFTRPACNSNIMADIICVNSYVKMCTVKKNIFEMKEYDTSYVHNSIQYLKVECSNNSSKRLIGKSSLKISNNLEKSKYIVVVGRGVGNKENCEVIEKFAKKIKAGFGVTRAVVENNWYNESYKIGQSGITVCPEVYIAFGVSGAMQHMAGVKEAKTIIAINHDIGANIFKYANYRLIEDVNNIIPFLKKFIET
jgi:electron transfer flavoprotein alpha subunit